MQAEFGHGKKKRSRNESFLSFFKLSSPLFCLMNLANFHCASKICLQSAWLIHVFFSQTIFLHFHLDFSVLSDSPDSQLILLIEIVLRDGCPIPPNLVSCLEVHCYPSVSEKETGCRPELPVNQDQFLVPYKIKNQTRPDHNSITVAHLVILCLCSSYEQPETASYAEVNRRRGSPASWLPGKQV